MFLVSPQVDFQTGPFSDFEQFKLNSHFDPTCFDPILIQFILLVQFSDFGQITVILMSLGKMLSFKKQFKPLSFDNKFRNHT